MPRVAVIADFLEERWPSMDLCAEQLAQCLGELEGFESLLLRPKLRGASRNGQATGWQRAVGRFCQLPLELGARRPNADYFHIADHSYAHLALLFPKDRVGIYCHDVDAFRAAFPGSGAPRSRVLLSRLLLKGLRHARVVFHNTSVVRDEILSHDLLPASRLVHARLGAAEEFLRVTPRDAARPKYLLHVGSFNPRKNVDFMLEVFSALARRDPELRLVQVGGQWTGEQRELLEREQLGGRVEQRTGIPRSALAELYAAAALVLVPSRAEGFGLPVLEALACGAPVIASDIPVFRELGLEGVRLCPTSSLADWTSAAEALLASSARVGEGARPKILAQYSWQVHAAVIAEAYAG